MSQGLSLGYISVALHVLIQAALIIRVLLRPHRQPASRFAWIVVVVSLPVLGIMAYLMVGETSIGRRRVARLRLVLSRLPDLTSIPGNNPSNMRDDIPQRYVHLFHIGKTVNGFDPVRINTCSPVTGGWRQGKI